jgi:hypothetical protein
MFYSFLKTFSISYLNGIEGAAPYLDIVKNAHLLANYMA